MDDKNLIVNNEVCGVPIDNDIVSTRDIYNKLLNIESALLRMHDMLYAELIRIREKI